MVKNKSAAGSFSRWICGIFAYILIVFLLIFLIFFVILPVVFKYSVEFQRSIVFPTWYITPKNYSDVDQYGLKGTRNFYVNVNQTENVTLGVWQVLPSSVISEFIDNNNYNYDGILADDHYDIVLYLHGNGQDRTEGIGIQQILRKFFDVIICDYRGYGDSSKAELNEQGLVSDTVALYKWLRSKTNANIFIWGHSLGTGVATLAIAKMKEENLIPAGVVLEAPFTSVTDVMKDNVLIQAFSWLFWFSSTIIDPIIKNGLNFDSLKNVVDVNCPIMILHAKDDSIIPYTQASRLYAAAAGERNIPPQGNVTYYLFDAVGFDHEYIHEAEQLPTYIEKFVKECQKYREVIRESG